jgi:hypothetical protein
MSALDPTAEQQEGYWQRRAHAADQRAAEATQRLEEAEAALALARRTIPCPWCEGPDTDCFACLGTGWTILCACCGGTAITGGPAVSACPDCGGNGVDEAEVAAQVALAREPSEGVSSDDQ